MTPRIRLLPHAVALAATLLATAAQAAVNAVARVEPENPNLVILVPGDRSSGVANSGLTSAASRIVTTIGHANAVAGASFGSLAGHASVALQTIDPNASGKLTAGASGSSLSQFILGDFCVGAVCNSAASLGIDRVVLGFTVLASGSVRTSSNEPRFHSGTATVAFGWKLETANRLAAGGGLAQDTTLSSSVNSIDDQSATLLVRPGEGVNLLLTMSLFSQAHLASFGFSDTSGSALAVADFAHTLRWGGVSSFQALDGGGSPIALDSGGRFLMLDGAGNDFWNPAPGVSVVPEPRSWALMLAGVLAVGWRLKRRV